MRLVVDGEAVDNGHCRIRIRRFVRDNIDSPETGGDPDAEFEWALINRVEPERAAAIRSELGDAGIDPDKL